MITPNKKPKSKTTVTVTLSAFEKEVLHEVALTLDRSRSWVVGAAIEHYARHGGPFDGHEYSAIIGTDAWHDILVLHGLSDEKT